MARINDLAGRYADDATADAAFVANGWDKSEGVVYYDTTLSQFKKWDEVDSAWVFDAGTPDSGDPAFPGIETVNCVFVDKGTNVVEDGSAQFPFHDMEDAVVAAAALAADAAIVVLGGAYSLAGALAPGTHQITIHGLGQVSITRAAHGTICDLTQDRKLTFRNCHLDGALVVSGTGAKLELIDCKFDGAIDVQNTTDASTLIKLTHTDIISDTTAKYPLYVNDVDPVIEIYDCYLEAPSVAGSGYSAIELIAKNDNLVVVQSDLIGYAWLGGVGEEVLLACPINGNGNDPSVTVYHCGLNAALSTVTNTIATPYNVEDTAIGLPRHQW